MPLPLDLAHRRYVQQASWTAPIRRHLLAKAGLPNAKRILEVGCGTGAVLQTLPRTPRNTQYGVDIDLGALQQAKQNASGVYLFAADSHYLPFASCSFDIVFTHFALLWFRESTAALREMSRVTRRGGAVLALAEPDYSKRFDQPAGLEKLGQLQNEALRAQGADPEMGSKLSRLFAQTGLSNIESGEISSGELAQTEQSDWELENSVLRADLEGRVPENELEELLSIDRAAWKSGERVLHIPTYWAFGRAL